MAVDIVALKAEITNDPKGVGYASKSDFDVSVAMNTPGLTADTIFRSYVSTEDIIACVVRAEYDALAAADKTYLNVVLAAARVNTGDSTLRGQVAAIFGPATTTRTKLTAIASRSCTRAEKLFGENATVSDSDVARARAS